MLHSVAGLIALGALFASFILTWVYRFSHSGRVCAGMYATDKEDKMVYMWATGKLLKFYFWL